MPLAPARGRLLRLVIAFGFAQAAVSMARPAVTYRALSLGADERTGPRRVRGRRRPLPHLAVFGFCLGVGQPLSMTTVVQAAPVRARLTALALRLTGNRLGQVAAPACAGLVAGTAGTAAPFALLGVLLLMAAGPAARKPTRPQEKGVRDALAGLSDAGAGRRDAGAGERRLPPAADASVQKAHHEPSRDSFPDRE